MKSKSFKDLLVWQKSMELVRYSYEIAAQLPNHELYALGDQIRRSSVSISSNIAEGSKRNGVKEFYQFCGIARGSAAELETQLLVVKMLHSNIDTSKALELNTQVQKMLTKLAQSLQMSKPKTTN